MTVVKSKVNSGKQQILMFTALQKVGPDVNIRMTVLLCKDFNKQELSIDPVDLCQQRQGFDKLLHLVFQLL